jgi:hypothetical protein
VGGKGQLGFDDRCRAGAQRGEHREERVALGIPLRPFMGGEPRPNEGVVISEDLGVGVVTEAPEQRRRGLDVGEEEGERLRGQSVRDCPGCRVFSVS